MKRLISILLILNILCFPMEVQAAAGGSVEYWSINIGSITLVNNLYTEETVVNYDGSQEVIKHQNNPSKGMVFAIVSIAVNKNDILANPIDASRFKLCIDDVEYSRLKDDSFLAYHNYNAFTSSTEVNISSRGTICFEIPEAYLQSSTIGWIVENGEIKSSPYVEQEAEVPLEPNIIEQQSEIEKYILAKYNSAEATSIDNPYVVLNPYNTAPLSALVMFETETASEVCVTIKGKNGAKDFNYTLSENTTHHEVPIIGLYADYENEVIIESKNNSCTLKIQTDSLPNDMEKPIINSTENSVALKNGFIFMAGNYRMLVDLEGEVRWYTTIQTGKDPSGVDCVSASDGIWFSIDPYYSGAQVYNMSWLGKILFDFSWSGSAHHDIVKVSESEYLFWGYNQLLKLDTNEQKISVYIDPSLILDSSVGSLEMRQENKVDWLHPNTVSYADGYLYLSFRNQHMLMKMDYETKEIIWVATPASRKDENGNIDAIQKGVADKMLLPADDGNFEWFYSQHEIVPLPDIDNNPNTDDFTLFDNGEERGVYGWYNGLTDKNDFYSRIVHYRVNLQTKTIEQIFEYGKEVQPSLSSYYYGGAQYVSEQSEVMYLGCFGMLDFANGTTYGNRKGSKIVAVSNTGEELCTWYFPEEYTYRAHYLSMSAFSSISAPALGTPGKAMYESNSSWTSWTEPQDNQNVLYEITEITQQQDGKLSLSGWAYLENDKEHTRNVCLIAKKCSKLS